MFVLGRGRGRHAAARGWTARAMAPRPVGDPLKLNDKQIELSLSKLCGCVGRRTLLPITAIAQPGSLSLHLAREPLEPPAAPELPQHVAGEACGRHPAAQEEPREHGHGRQVATLLVRVECLVV